MSEIKLKLKVLPQPTRPREKFTHYRTCSGLGIVTKGPENLKDEEKFLN
ncbi:hypothetical protein J7J81_02285 [bacterium]|nr:hypothetical protein [bacterium]